MNLVKGALVNRACRAALIVLVIGTSSFAFPTLAGAATLTVTRTDDPTPGACDSDCSLREAVIAANATPTTSDTIVLPDLGTDYVLQLAGSDNTAALGDLDITSPVKIKGTGRTIRQQDPPVDRVLHVTFTGSLTIIGTEIRDGKVDAPDGGGGGIRNQGVLDATSITVANNDYAGAGVFEGGGIRNEGTAVIRSSLIKDNDVPAAGAGAGIGNSGTLTLLSSTVRNNAGAGGGGLASNAPTGDLSVVDSVFEGNSASPAQGGGISIGNAASALIDSTRFIGNTAKFGGGLYAVSAVTITRSAFTRNSVVDGGGGANVADPETVVDGTRFAYNTAGAGGGLYVQSGAAVRDSVFSRNSASSGGGAIALESSDSTFTLETSLVYNNSAGFGGGFDIGSTDTTIEDSTIAQNAAAGDGGGLLFNSADDALTINRSTIVENRADSDANTVGDGGGIRRFGAAPLTLHASILANNVDGPGTSNPDCTGALTSGDDNVVEDITGCSGITDGVNNDEVADPLLSPFLVGNGGPTLTYSIGTNSPALDRNAGCSGTDQRGAPRPFGSACDAGAYELVRCGLRVVNVVGTPENDKLLGTNGDDGIIALGGNDKLFGYAGDDSICGGDGNDVLDGGDGNDVLRGDAGTDKCKGQLGNDQFNKCETAIQ
jgi:CSLREA domain-containing protein